MTLDDVKFNKSRVLSFKQQKQKFRRLIAIVLKRFHICTTENYFIDTNQKCRKRKDLRSLIQNQFSISEKIKVHKEFVFHYDIINSLPKSVPSCPRILKTLIFVSMNL